MPELIAGNARQKLQRLGAMRPREVAHRVCEKMSAELERVGIASSCPKPPSSFKAYLAGGPASRFYCSHQQDIAGFARDSFPEWIGRAAGLAETHCAHEVALLGYPPVHLGAAIDWHRDPVTGRTWERRFWADYDLVHHHGGRDPKIIHELNRHQHLPRLAKAYRLTGDERYASEAVAQLLSWIDQNPPGRGINWQSSLEIAIRATSWMWTIFLLLPSRSFDAASAQRVGESLFAQLEHVYRFTSLYSSPNTHLIGEAAALFIGGLVFRDQKPAAKWLHGSALLLSESAEKQVLDNAVYGELSSYYHCYALDFYLQAMILAAQNGFDLGPAIPHKVGGMLEYLMFLTRPDGTLPSLGDDDGGRALALDQRDYRSYRDGLCVGAIVCRRGDFKRQAGTFCEEAFWLLGEESWNVYRELPAKEPGKRRATYGQAGYTIVRSGWDARASHLVFDCGGLGILTGGHAHADALSFTLFCDGRELLVDPGTFVYNCAPEWRSYFRSTAAHNTVRVDGRDQAEQGGTFRWTTRLDARKGEEFEAAGVTYVEGEHDGYSRIGVTHRRRILYADPGCWIVADDFRGSGEHQFEFNYHLTPGAGELLQIDFVSMAEGTGSRARLVSDEQGWVSRAYGEKQPCTTRRTTLRAATPAAAFTFLMPGTRRAETQQYTIENGTGIACACEHGDYTDIAALSTSSADLCFADFQMSGEFCWIRLERGVLKQVLAIRARSLTRAGRNIVRTTNEAPYFRVFDAETRPDTLCAEFAAS
ncbi:MAG TPA: alginate lyase family protein [Bryobacteraceae bacterium]|nr:alginate lyase family protein [Bryobacteraceae bacterium]